MRGRCGAAAIADDPARPAQGRGDDDRFAAVHRRRGGPEAHRADRAGRLLGDDQAMDQVSGQLLPPSEREVDQHGRGFAWSQRRTRLHLAERFHHRRQAFPAQAADHPAAGDRLDPAHGHLRQRVGAVGQDQLVGEVAPAVAGQDRVRGGEDLGSQRREAVDRRGRGERCARQGQRREGGKGGGEQGRAADHAGSLQWVFSWMGGRARGRPACSSRRRRGGGRWRRPGCSRRCWRRSPPYECGRQCQSPSSS